MPNLTEFVYISQQGEEVFCDNTQQCIVFVGVSCCCLVDRLLLAFMENTLFMYLEEFCVLMLFRCGM